MKITNKILEFDESFNKWLINNRIKWCFILFGLGMILGLSGIIFIDMELKRAILMGLSCSSLLLIVEIGTGGKGIEQ